MKALKAAYPQRFDRATPFYFKDPVLYASALLRAVIADNLVRRGRVAVRSDSTSAMLVELDRVTSVDGQTFGCLWVLSDVDFEEVHEQDIGPIRLHAARQPREHIVSNLLPEALWVGGHGYPLPGEQHQGLLWATGMASGHKWDVTAPLNAAIARFVTILHLATGTTSQLRMTWTGEPSMVHIEPPLALPELDSGMGPHWGRIARVTTDQLEGLRELTQLVETLESASTTKTLPSVVIAMRRYARSYRNNPWQDTVLDLATALEACLAPPKEEAGLTLRMRAAHLLAHEDSDQAEVIYRDVEDLYNLRSDIIHGNATLRKDLTTMWSERGYDMVFEQDRMYNLLDRWREIVRQAIAARLFLGDSSVGTPLWPLTGKQVKVDRCLVRKDARDEWRTRIKEGALRYGLPLLAEPTPPLIDFLSRSS